MTSKMDLLETDLDEGPCTVTICTVNLTEKTCLDWVNTDASAKLTDPKHLHLTLEDNVGEISSGDIPDIVIPSTSRSGTFLEDLSSEICFEDIHDHIGIDHVPSFISKPELNQDTENSVPLSVYPDLLLLNDGASPDSPIDINNIQLYLECSDDSEAVIAPPSVNTQNTNTLIQNGTSLLKSDVQLKISFPVIQEETEKRLICSFCKRYFYQEQKLRLHVHEEHRETVQICRFCSYNTKSNKYFQNHVKTKHKEISDSFFKQQENNISFLPISGDSYFYDDQEGSDIEAKTANIYQCDINHKNCNVDIFCGKSNASQFKNYESFNSPREAQVENCDKNEENYIRADYNKSSVECKKVLSAYEFHRHLEPSCTQPTKCKKFSCSICDFVTKSSKLLKHHHSTMHDSNRNVFKCTECSYVCKQKRSLLTHQKLHEGVFNFQCDVCMKKFVSKAIHTRHVKTHISNRQFSCSVKDCNKSFKNQGALTDHRKKVHERDTSVNDTIFNVGMQEKCSKGTCTNTDRELSKSNKSTGLSGKGPLNLKQFVHTNSHTVLDSDRSSTKQKCNATKQKSQVQKSFACCYPNCNKAFRDNFNLRNHMFIHEGLKNVNCRFCEFACVQKSSLNYHMTKKHPEQNMK